VIGDAVQREDYAWMTGKRRSPAARKQITSSAVDIARFGARFVCSCLRTLVGALGVAMTLAVWSSDAAATSDQFGYSVAVDGNNVLIGEVFDDTFGQDVGQVHLFDATTGALLQTFDDPTITTKDEFGFTVAIDGTNVLIGAPEDDTNGNRAGQVYLFDATTGTLLQTFNDPTITTEDLFGSSVAIDGNNVLIGAAADDTNGSNV